MHPVMDLELLNCINMDMKWNILKKGRSGVTRRPRKLGEESTFETNKFGTEKVVDAPLKKPRKTPCITGEIGVTPEKSKSKTKLRKRNIVKPKKNQICIVDDFSGIELLAAAACSSLVNDFPDRVDDLSVMKEVKSSAVAIKEAIVLPELNVSPIQVENNVISSFKGLRLHWDLNTPMNEWEEPCDDMLVQPQSRENCLKSKNSTLEGCGSRCTDAVGLEEKITLDFDAAISVQPLVVCTETLNGKISDDESSVGKSAIDLLPNQVKSEDMSTSTTSVLREQTTVIGESLQSPKLCKSLCDNRVTSDGPLSECCGSNVTQEEQGPTTEGDSEEKLEVGYDSPFEDGELREPVENRFSKKDDVLTVENTLLEEVDNDQRVKGQSSLFVKETVPSNDIELGPRLKSPDLSERKVQRTRSINFGDFYSRPGKELGVEKTTQRDMMMNQFHSRNYNPRGGAYRSQNRRHSPSEKNTGYGSNRGPPVRYHSRDRYNSEHHDFKPYNFERKPHFPPKLNRPRSRSRSRSGSPIAWNFQKRKTSDVCKSVENEHASPERSSKFSDHQNRDTRRSPVIMTQRNQRPEAIRYPERLKSDDHFQYTQHFRKQNSHYEKVNRLGRHDDDFRRSRYNDSFENRNRRNLDSFSEYPPKEQIPESRK